MNKIVLAASILFSINNFAQENTIDATLIDIGKKGNADIKDIKVVGDHIFFTGKEFNKRNFAKFNFTENNFTTFNTDEELLDYNNIFYIVINNEIYYKPNSNTIKKTNNLNQFEVFYTGNDILDFKQISDSHFTFTNKRPSDDTNRNFYYDLYLFNGTNNSLIRLNEDDLNLSISNIIYTPNNTIYYKTSNNNYYKYSIDNNQLNYLDTTLPNLRLLSIENDVFAINNSYSSTNSIYKLNQNNQFELVNQLTEQNVSYYNIENILEHNRKNYFISNEKLFVLDAETNTIQAINTINIEAYYDLQIYNNEIYIRIKSPWPSEYKTYKINGTQVEEFLIPDYSHISSFIIFDHKIFYNSNAISFNDNFKYYDLRTRETNNINLNYNFPNTIIFSNPFIYNNNLYFNSNSEFDGLELFKYNSEINEVEILKNYNTTGHSSPNQFEKVNNKILFFADENHIHSLNLENNQTDLLFDTQKNIFRSLIPKMSINLGDKLIFSNENFELGFTDGTANGTSIFQRRAENENALQYFTEHSVKLNNKAIFRGNTRYKGEEIWVSDGTIEGTTILQDILVGYEHSTPVINKNGILNNKLYFTAKKENYHNQSSSLFVTEGTPESTVRINYNESGLNELTIFGSFQNKLIIAEKINSSYDINYFILDPITLEKIILNVYHTPEHFFEYNNTLYLSEYNNLGYYDENFQLQNIAHQQSISLKPLKKIGNKLYLESLENGYIYALENNQLQIIQDNNIYRRELRDIIIQDDKILFLIINSFDNNSYSTLQLATIDANGISYRNINLQDFGISPIYFTKLNIIDNKIYLGISHPKYGEELYIANYEQKPLNTSNLNTPIEFKNEFYIYPNPTKDEFYINSKSNNKILTIDIFNLTGQKLKSIKIKPQEKIITNDLLPGIHFVKISNGANTETKKLIIK